MPIARPLRSKYAKRRQGASTIRFDMVEKSEHWEPQLSVSLRAIVFYTDHTNKFRLFFNWKSSRFTVFRASRILHLTPLPTIEMYQRVWNIGSCMTMRPSFLFLFPTYSQTSVTLPNFLVNASLRCHASHSMEFLSRHPHKLL